MDPSRRTSLAFLGKMGYNYADPHADSGIGAHTRDENSVSMRRTMDNGR
jgi:hypothetical protein